MMAVETMNVDRATKMRPRQDLVNELKDNAFTHYETDNIVVHVLQFDHTVHLPNITFTSIQSSSIEIP